MCKFILALSCLFSTSYACHYCDDCRAGVMASEDLKTYIDSGIVLVQDGEIIWLHEGKCCFLASLHRDDRGVYVWPDQIIYSAGVNK